MFIDFLAGSVCQACFEAVILKYTTTVTHCLCIVFHAGSL